MMEQHGRDARRQDQELEHREGQWQSAREEYESAAAVAASAPNRDGGQGPPRDPLDMSKLPDRVVNAVSEAASGPKGPSRPVVGRRTVHQGRF